MHRVNILCNQIGANASRVKTTKKPLHILLALTNDTTDAQFSPLLNHIVHTFGTAAVFPIDQPIVFHILLTTTNQIKKTIPETLFDSFSAGCTISHAFQTFTWDQDQPLDLNGIQNGFDIAIIQGQSSIQSFITTYNTQQATQQPKESAITTKKSTHSFITNRTRVLIVSNTPEHVLTDVSSFVKQAPLFPHQNIQGLAKSFTNAFVTSLVHSINRSNAQNNCPSIAFRDKVHNVFLSSTGSNVTVKTKFAIITDYPLHGRVVPLDTIVQSVFSSNYSFSFTNYPISPQAMALGIAQQLFEWVEGTQQGVFTSFCVVTADNQAQNADSSVKYAPCQSYAGNVAILTDVQ